MSEEKKAPRLKAVSAHTLVMPNGQGIPLAAGQVLPPLVAEHAINAGDPDLYETVEVGACKDPAHRKAAARIKELEQQLEAEVAAHAETKAEHERQLAEAASVPDDAPEDAGRQTRKGSIS